MSPRHLLDVAQIDSDVLEHDLDVAQMSSLWAYWGWNDPDLGQRHSGLQDSQFIDCREGQTTALAPTLALRHSLPWRPQCKSSLGERKVGWGSKRRLGWPQGLPGIGGEKSKKLKKKYFIYLTAAGLSCGLWDLVPWPGIEPVPPALGAWSPSHWIAREVPLKHFLIFCPVVAYGGLSSTRWPLTLGVRTLNS